MTEFKNMNDQQQVAILVKAFADGIVSAVGAIPEGLRGDNSVQAMALVAGLWIAGNAKPGRREEVVETAYKDIMRVVRERELRRSISMLFFGHVPAELDYPDVPLHS